MDNIGHHSVWSSYNQEGHFENTISSCYQHFEPCCSVALQDPRLKIELNLKLKYAT